MNSSDINLGSILLIPLLLLMLGAQSRFFAYLPVRGVTVQLLPIVAITWGIWRGDAGAVALAFIGGMLIDFNSIAPNGANALALIFAVLGILPLRQILKTNRAVAPFLLACVGMFLFLLLHHILLQLFGYDVGRAWSQLPITIGVHAIIIFVVYWILRTFGRVTGTRQSDLLL